KEIVRKVADNVASNLGKQVRSSDGLPEPRDDPTRKNPNVYEGYVVPLSKAYFDRAALRNREGAFAEAHIDLTYCLDLKPAQYEAHELLGDLNSRWKGNTAEGINEAIKAYRQSIKNFSDEKNRIQRAKLYEKLGQACARLPEENKDEAI